MGAWNLEGGAITGQHMGLNDILLTIAAAQAFFAAAILVFGRRERSRPSVLLGTFLFLYGVTFIADLASVRPLYVTTSFVVPLSFMFYLLLGPTLYFYVKELTRQADEPLIGSIILHILPVLIGTLLIAAWMVLPPEYRSDAINNEFEADDLFLFVAGLAVIGAQVLAGLQISAYLLASLRRLFQHLSSVEDFFSNLENKTLSWLRILLFFMIAVWIADLITDGADNIGRFGPLGETLFTLGELVVLYVLVFRGMRQPGVIFAPFDPDDDGEVLRAANIVQLNAAPEADTSTTVGHPTSAPKGTQRKYAKSALDHDSMVRIADKLDTAMTRDRLFMDSTVNLADLSRHIGVSQNYLSQTLNQKLSMKFYDYIALHRVEAAKEILASDEDSKTILEIALEVGFNSKSTFNAAFKRHAGLTPSEFRQENRTAA